MNGLRLFLASAVISFLLSGCGDPTRNLLGNYKLTMLTDGELYFVVDARHDVEAGGVFAGSVEQLGFTRRWILAYVHKNVARAFEDNRGWYALNEEDGRSIGPIPERDIKTDPVWSAIRVQKAASVFESLE